MGGVVVVGAGPAGALLSFLLARAGIEVTLLERHSDFAREFRGEGLSPDGLAMFREAGLWDAFEELPQTVIGAVEIYHRGRRMAAMSLDWVPDELAPRLVSQPAMLEMLVGASAGFDRFRFAAGVRAVDVIRDGATVRGVVVRDGDHESELHADYVFATDGRYSALRKAAGLDTPTSPQSFDVVWFKIPLPDFDVGGPPVMRGFFGDGKMGLAFPSYDGRLQVGWVIRKGRFGDLRARGVEHWVREMADHLSPAMSAHVLGHVDEIVHPFLLDVVSDHHPIWSVPGLTMLGDAAHPMSPVGAQGVNIALRDAVAAANHFVPHLRGEVSLTDLARAALGFQEDRRAEVVGAQRMQALAPAFTLGTAWWIDGVVWTIRALDRARLLPPLARLLARVPNPMVRSPDSLHLQV